ncbi:DNA polymerase III subunit delta [Pantoea sp. Aalb]|uniref:DNA polymerase III subunit delta n=1 Tax=Pantoea sp. Aalb TaxID=2576762 RepID=UPI00132604A2|nr:DNA polymerase III subunit delta [Pantoea sp. Aalb]MXP67550.1 DNA polymerase III subunit delta [Pantoea sp. Aalb]
MIKIYPEQLKYQLLNKLNTCYFITGNEDLLIQESIDAILTTAIEQGFTEHINIAVDSKTDWDMLFINCQSLNLFTNGKTLILKIPENNLTIGISEKLIKLSKLLHNSILLILRINKLTKNHEKTFWFKKLSMHAILVSCQTPEQANLSRWIINRAKTMNLKIDEDAVQLFCYCYEGNLITLVQVLENLSMLWADRHLTLPRVKEVVRDAANFTPLHWINAILAGKSKRVQHILYQMEKEDIEIIVLLRSLQRDLLILIQLQRNYNKYPIRTLMDQHYIWQNRRSLFIEALHRLNSIHLKHAINLLTILELSLKQDYNQNLWEQLENLSLLLCQRNFSIIHLNI